MTAAFNLLAALGTLVLVALVSAVAGAWVVHLALRWKERP